MVMEKTQFKEFLLAMIEFLRFAFNFALANKKLVGLGVSLMKLNVELRLGLN